ADSCRWKEFLQPLLPLLRASSQKVEVFALALWALRRNGPAKAAVVAFEPLAGLSNGIITAYRLVVGNGDGTVFALDLFAAASAHHRGRVAAPVEQQDHLLAAV